MKKDIVFNADELVQAVEGVRDHVMGKKKITMRTTRMALPANRTNIKPMGAAMGHGDGVTHER